MFSLDKAYGASDGELNVDPYDDVNIAEKIQEYKEKVATAIVGGKPVGNIDELPQIKDFFTMKSVRPEKEKIRYMSLKEYQNQNRDCRALETVQGVLGNETPDVGTDSESKKGKSTYSESGQNSGSKSH